MAIHACVSRETRTLSPTRLQNNRVLVLSRSAEERGKLPQLLVVRHTMHLAPGVGRVGLSSGRVSGLIARLGRLDRGLVVEAIAALAPQARRRWLRVGRGHG